MSSFFIHLHDASLLRSLGLNWSGLLYCSNTDNSEAPNVKIVMQEDTSREEVASNVRAPHPVLDATKPVEDYGSMSTLHIEQALRGSVYGGSTHKNCGRQSPCCTTSLWELYIFAQVLHGALWGPAPRCSSVCSETSSYEVMQDHCRGHIPDVSERRIHDGA